MTRRQGRFWARGIRWLSLAGFLGGVLALHGQTAAEGEIARLVQQTAIYQSGQSMESLRRLEALARRSSTDARLRTELEAGLVRLLNSGSTLEAKQFACQQLATIGTESSIPAIAALLDRDQTAGLACQTLSTHPSPKAAEALRQALSKLTGPTRVQVIGTLGERRDPEAVPLLASLVNSPDSSAAAAAIIALGKIANEPARTLVAALARRASKDEHSGLARSIFEASMITAERLAASGERDAAASLYAVWLDSSQPDNLRRGAFEALLQLDEDGGERRIIETLRGTDSTLKPVAIAGMRLLRSPEASARFAAALPSLSPDEQAWLVEALGARRDDAARRVVESSLASPHPAVRLAAIQAIPSNADANTVGLLCHALEASIGSPERTAIERALISLPRDSEFDQAIIDAFGQGALNAKRTLTGVFARRQSRAAVPVLLETADLPDLGESTFRALGSLAAPEDAPLLLGKLSQLKATQPRGDAEYAVGQALRKMNDPAGRADIVVGALSKATDRETRLSLIRLLPVCADARSLAILDAARHDPEPQVRDAALRALVEWPDNAAWNALLATVGETTNQVHRTLAFHALTRLAEEGNGQPAPENIQQYRALLEKARTDDDRRLVLGALSGSAHPDALNLVLPLLSTPGVHDEAALAVRVIAERIGKDHPQAAAAALRKLE